MTYYRAKSKADEAAQAAAGAMASAQTEIDTLLANAIRLLAEAVSELAGTMHRESD